MLEALRGQKIPGGCDDCHADQTVESDPEHPGLTHINVFHDDTCPNYQKRLNRAARRAQRKNR